MKEITGLGLKEAKEVVDNAPKTIKEAVSKAEAEEIKTKLEEAGAKMCIRDRRSVSRVRRERNCGNNGKRSGGTGIRQKDLICR